MAAVREGCRAVETAGVLGAELLGCGTQLEGEDRSSEFWDSQIFLDQL